MLACRLIVILSKSEESHPGGFFTYAYRIRSFTAFRMTNLLVSLQFNSVNSLILKIMVQTV